MADQHKIDRWTNPFSPNPAWLRQALISEGLSVEQWSDRPNMVFANRKNPTGQSHWVAAGAIEMSVNGVGRYVLKAGDRNFIPAETYYSYRIVSDETAIYFIGVTPAAVPAKTKKLAAKPKATKKPTKKFAKKTAKAETATKSKTSKSKKVAAGKTKPAAKKQEQKRPRRKRKDKIQEESH